MVTKEELVEVLLKHQELELVRALEIRDVVIHESDIADLSKFSHAQVYIINELDQACEIQLKGNWFKTHSGSIDINTAFSVASGAVGSKAISVAQLNWYPFIWLTMRCSVAPTRGAIHVKVLAKPI